MIDKECRRLVERCGRTNMLLARDIEGRFSSMQSEIDAQKLAEPAVEYHGPKPTIVCLCGSTRFMEYFYSVGWELTLQGKIVLSIGVCKHAEDHGGEALGQDVADMLDELHKRKIDLADEVWILNVAGYIGESTRSEIEYAIAHHKPVHYLEAVDGA